MFVAYYMKGFGAPQSHPNGERWWQAASVWIQTAWGSTRGSDHME